MPQPTSETMMAVVESQVGNVLATFAASLDRVADLERLKRKELLTTDEVEALYGLSAATLDTWRCRGGGPDYVKPSKSVFYRHTDIQKFLEARMVKGRV